MLSEEVILVDRNDQVLGTMEKMEAHLKGELHRAFSVMILNHKNEMLIHQRADEKYHSGGLWTNACCSHPRLGETTEEAAHRRLMEEMGFDCDVEEVFSFIYRAELDQGLIEHELDHLLVGYFNGDPKPNPDEVKDWKYVNLDLLYQDIKSQPENYTEWFKIALKQWKQQALAPSNENRG